MLRWNKNSYAANFAAVAETGAPGAARMWSDATRAGHAGLRLCISSTAAAGGSKSLPPDARSASACRGTRCAS
eukprot:g54154.t1